MYGKPGNGVGGVGGSSRVTTGTGPGGGVVTGSSGVMLCGTVVSASAGGVGIAQGGPWYDRQVQKIIFTKQMKQSKTSVCNCNMQLTL